MRLSERHTGLLVALILVSFLILFLPFRSITGTSTGTNKTESRNNPIIGLSDNLKDSRLVLNIWYGSHQVFGQLGVPQRWINILGNVSDPDGISALTFSLNGGKEYPLNMGPDRRRLIAPGDFNIEIEKGVLNIGLNQVAVRATDMFNNQTVRKVTVEYKGNSWPLPYSIDWSGVTNVQDVVQIVDGLWVLDGTGIRTHPLHVGYDRVIAIGDMTWRDYEVTFPFVIHAIDATAYESPISIGPSFGINMHWLGHTDSPVTCSQPHCGWEPTGGSNWYKFRKNRDNGLRIIAGPSHSPTHIIDLPLEMGKTYRLKARVQTTPAGNLYTLKVWEDGSKPEPEDWTLRKLARRPNLDQGSFLLVAHHVDMTFGSITVVPLEGASLSGAK